MMPPTNPAKHDEQQHGAAVGHQLGLGAAGVLDALTTALVTVSATSTERNGADRG
jgi:hypothetical protein